MERLWPHSPAPLVAVAGGIAASWFLGLQAMGVSTVGLIPQGFPSLTLPDPALIAQLVPGALGIALMSFTETIAAGRAFVGNEEPPVRANQELFALGLANAGGALLGAMPAGGGTTQTAVNRLAGARTQMAQLITAGATLLTMLFLAPLIGLMPEAALAAIVIVYSIGRFKPVEFRAILNVRRTEFIWANTTISDLQTSAFLNRRTITPFGYYVSGDYQLGRRWFLGARFDRSERGVCLPTIPSTTSACPAFTTNPLLHDTGGSVLLTYWPSEFSQIRGQLRRTRYGEGLTANEFLFQFLFSMGAHGAHPF
jgi:hypothetical protein